MSAAEQRAAAREAYRQSVAAGAAFTGAKLAAEFGRSERWGRDRIAEVRAEDAAGDNSPAAEQPADAGRHAAAQPRGAAATAWLALALGVGASVGANILHTVLVIGNGGGSVPQVAGAAFWPIALVVAIEVMARVRWPASIGYSLIRFAGVGAVAVVAAVVSYKHMAGLLAYWGEDVLSAHLGPIAVDGLVTVGALALLAIHKARKET
ncbi:DUF2637 domain-containing protein [Glycomyces sp. L485]|uniref:DUF2637 domain-containing protein n=1 Tax=Glycomyces sp. L485 TaxID=2909235 RepID=UPI001F4A7273|nr:DUF2637 domain-containing protein [Glycomyces sp. L485]MCH7229607.1 DUF2637 domain-containing protein [Glycomyces sp. L485]